MKAPFFGKKNICKKPKIPPRKKDISFDRYKKRINTEISEDLESRNSDEERGPSCCRKILRFGRWNK